MHGFNTKNNLVRKQITHNFIEGILTAKFSKQNYTGIFIFFLFFFSKTRTTGFLERLETILQFNMHGLENIVFQPWRACCIGLM
jgi:hypothetical protein